MQDAEELLKFWIEEVGPKGWYAADESLDTQIRTRWEAEWLAAQAEDHMGWCTTPRQTMALIILLDQFPRNMYRGDAKAYSTDAMARGVAAHAIDLGWDRRAAEPERQFHYLPFMHSECLGDQERCVRLMMERLPETGASNLTHARAHREIIRRFGRFPYRNVELGRANTPEEDRFLAAGGYRSVLQEMTEAA